MPPTRPRATKTGACGSSTLVIIVSHVIAGFRVTAKIVVRRATACRHDKAPQRR